MDLARPDRTRRKPSLTPMIDVVFLLLVFFMLASRFGMDAVLPMPLAAGGGSYDGPPRLIDVTPREVRLNGVRTSDTLLVDALEPLMATSGDIIILRGQDGATLQRIVQITEVLRTAGLAAVVLVK